jgi:diguanylate cyclase (GGDEF)-like protein
MPKLPPKPIALALCVLALTLIGLADILTGEQTSLAVLYVLPIMAASWLAGLSWGLGLAGMSVALLLAVGAIAGHPFQHIGYFAFSVFSDAATYALLAWLVSRLARALAREHNAARSDPLTGLPNRAALYDALQHESERQRRYGHPLALGYIDCDNFKVVNDSQGHLAGDQLLQAVAQTLRSSMRRTDFSARLGGDEFAILLPETTLDQAHSAVELLRAKLAQRMQEGGWPVDFSIGVAAFTSAPASPSAALQAADGLMYRAKTQGKGRVLCEPC